MKACKHEIQEYERGSKKEAVGTTHVLQRVDARNSRNAGTAKVLYLY